MILLSLLIPSLPERAHSLAALLANLPLADPRLEVLILTDNRRRSLPAKRNEMTRMARGKFIAHVDDDELLSDGYFDIVAPFLEQDHDLVYYDAGVSFNGSPEFRVTSILGAECEHPSQREDGTYTDIVRPPWHWSCWRTEFARRFPFDENVKYGEDWTFLKQALPMVRKSHKIKKVLFHHRFDAEKTTFPTAQRS